MHCSIDYYTLLSLGPPEWMPDELSSSCMACKVQFTILRRRHHCRNCGKVSSQICVKIQFMHEMHKIVFFHDYLLAC